MAEIQPIQALHYNLQKTGGLQPVLAPPYDVIDERQRAELERRSPYNVVRIDLPRGDGRDPYQAAAEQLAEWRTQRVVIEDPDPALWPLAQDYTGPDGRRRTRRGVLARVRVEQYGAGRIRPHERTHPGPKEDRLRLTRATRANLSPIFSLYDDPSGAAWAALEPATGTEPWAQASDDDGTVNRIWRVDDAQAIAELQGALKHTELLIADGHHRYETARVYADERGGEGPHRYVLMCLVALQDPGLTVFPTHRLVRGLDEARRKALADTIARDFELEPLRETGALVPLTADPTGAAPTATAQDAVRIGYIDARAKQPMMLTLKRQEIADAALGQHSEPYRRLDTAVLEGVILKGTLGMTDEDIDHLAGLGYARDTQQAIELIQSSAYEAAFFMSPTPVQRVQAVAASGESMPPKSTYFYPKVPTGLVFNPLE